MAFKKKIANQLPTQVTYPREGLAKPIDAAAFLSVSKDTIYRMVGYKELPIVMIRGDMRTPWDALHKIAAGETP